jgi:hypothetical protein
MDCAVCAARGATMGALCDDCRDDVAVPFGVMPEQLLVSALRPTAAALVDAWGRAQRLDARAAVGRQLGTSGVGLIDGSISRHHAILGYDAAGDAWSVEDVGSRNGTFVNGAPITTGAPAPLRSRDIVAFGQVAFYFLADARAVPVAELDPRAAATLPTDHAVRAPAAEELAQEDTYVGRRFLEMRLYEPTGGGGGVLEVRGHRVQLSPVQLECLRLLAQRMLEDAEQPDALRGFVSTAELLTRLSWETADPGDANAKQVVRKLRSTLAPAIGDLIESRRGAGYRLRVIPILGPG